jgi:hypothetical protein
LRKVLHLEALIVVEILCDDAKQIVVASRHQVTFEHLWDGLNDRRL